MKTRLALAQAALALLLAGCSTLQPYSATQATPVMKSLLTPEEMAPPPEEQSPHPTAFRRDVLARLLVAEFAAQQEDYATLLRNYREVAVDTQDPGVIERAVRIAQFVKDEEALTELALLWAKNEPANVEAHQLAAFQLIKAKRYQEAIAQMEAVMGLGGASRFDRLALHAQNLNEEERHQLTELYRQLMTRHPDEDEIAYGYALLLEMDGQLDAALAITTDLIRHSDDENILALHARMLANKDLEQGLAFLQQATREQPESLILGTLHARMLIKAEKLEDAMSEYERLMALQPEASHLRLSHALVALEARKYDIARSELEALVRDNKHQNEAQFFLGRLADLQNRTDEAIQHYLAVRQGGRYFDALGRAAYLLLSEGRNAEAQAAFDDARNQYPDQAAQLWDIQINVWMQAKHEEEALRLADQAISEYPDDIQLRYARAMLNDRLGNAEAMEEDLRYILELEPDNATAMNALGYSWANRNVRLAEARDLIARALELDPDNPAIMDSMGWVLYRLGDPETALTWVHKAWDKMKDPEVAAHLGELLWLKGERDKAAAIWKEGLEKAPDHPIIRETMERLGAGSL
ncbi:tetratricopeptide repeat protein [Hahella sp. SMD15-11]|uniref:Tetratricopeptide repeat protein n=1 Tax=Thermohahella caldifontis TaxID=3142973 RepID=A0AB39UW47_9GAMM